MAFTADELTNISNSLLENYIDKGTVFKQNVANKPMLKAFDESRGSFGGGKEYVSVGVKSGQGGGSMSGYTGDDQLSFYNPASTKRAKYAWKEHHLGIAIQHTELKQAGIDVADDNSTSMMADRDKFVLAELLEEKLDDLGEDYAKSMDSLIHGDGSTDTKALAGIQSIILASPGVGTTGTISRSANTWWQNRAATVANGLAGGQGAITSSTSGGGALLNFLQKDLRLLGKYAQGGTKHRYFAGNDFIDAMEKELRANGNYTQSGFMRAEAVDGGLADVTFKGKKIEWDPTLDDLGLGKSLFVIDMKRIQLLYMDGQRMKKHNPTRPYDRLVMYSGITTTAVMVAKQLNTSARYDIA